jgi:hypothetical protein
MRERVLERSQVILRLRGASVIVMLPCALELF